MTPPVRLTLVACTVAGLIAAGRPTGPPLALAAGSQHARATIHWDRVPLGEAVARLADVLKADVIVDRRVDPSQRVSLAARDASGPEILSQLAAANSLGVSHLGQLMYLGPHRSADELRTLAELRRQDVAGLPRDERTALRRAQAVHWPQLTEPRELIVGLLSERGWTVRRAELIPHDLWPTGRLPALALSDQLTALLVGFDLTYRIVPGQRAVEITEIERPVRLARRYRWPAGSRPDGSLLRQQLPDSSVRVEGQAVEIDGRLEDHERLVEMLAGRTTARRPTPPRRPARRLFTLHIEEQPVGVVLRQLGRQLDLTVDVDDAAVRAAGLSLDRRVSLSVDGVELDELLSALLAAAGLDYQRDGNRLTIFPRRNGS